MCDATFVVFAIVFGVTRLIIYPNWILRSLTVNLTLITGRYMGVHFYYLTLLGSLQVLHIFWFSTIVKMVCDRPFHFSHFLGLRD